MKQQDLSSPQITGIAIALFILALIPRILQLDYFLMVDESLWFERSARFLQGLVSGNLAQTVQTGHPGVTTMWSGTIGLLLYYFKDAAAYTSLANFANEMVGASATLAVLRFMRFTVVFVSAATVAAAFVLGRSLLGTPAALIGAGLMAFEPFFIAHSRALHHDALAASFSLLAILGWLLYLKVGQSRYLLLGGAGIALAVLSKISALYLLGFAGLTLLPQLWQRRQTLRSDLWQIIKPWLLLTGAALLTLVLLWPAMWAAPDAVWQTFVEFISKESGPHARGSFFMGQPIPDPGLLFYPVGLAFYLTPFTLGGVFLALIGIAVNGRPNRVTSSPGSASRNWTWAAWLILYSLLFVFYISFISKKQMRYVLPAMLSLNLVAGWGWYWLLSKISPLTQGDSGQAQGNVTSSHQFPQVPTRTNWLSYLILVPIITGGQFLFMLSARPYYSIYFNPLLGGAPKAQEILPIGRGEGLDEAARYILANAETPDNTLKVASWYGGVTGVLLENKAQVKDALHPNFILESDYVVFYVNQLQRQLTDEGIIRYVEQHLPLLHTVRLAGIDYAYVYQGRAISNPVDPFAPENRLTGEANLTGFDLLQTPVAGANTPLKIYWINKGLNTGDHFYVRLTDTLKQDWAWGSCAVETDFDNSESWQKGDIIESVCQLVVYPATPPGQYLLRVGLIAKDGTVVGQMPLTPQEGTVYVERPADFPADEAIPMETRVAAKLNQALALIGYDFSADEIRPGEALPITFYWRSPQAPETDYQVQLTLRGDGPGQFAQWQSAPVNGQYPTTKWLENEAVRDPWTLNLPLNLPGGTYAFEVVLIDANSRASDSFALPPLTIAGREHGFTLPEPPVISQTARLGDDIQLLGYDLAGADNGILTPGKEIDVSLVWQAIDAPGQNYNVFVQLLNQANQLIAQHDGQPGDGNLATVTWADGEYIHDTHRLILPADLSSGDYRLIVGMYRPDTGERLPVFNANGQSDGDFISLNVNLAAQ